MERPGEGEGGGEGREGTYLLLQALFGRGIRRGQRNGEAGGGGGGGEGTYLLLQALFGREPFVAGTLRQSTASRE